MKHLLLYILLITGFVSPIWTHAQESVLSFPSGTVEKIVKTSYPIILGREVESQELLVSVDETGSRETVFNDYTPVNVGDKVFLTPGYNVETEQEVFYVREIDRLWSTAGVCTLFLIMYLTITGWRGLRSLTGLIVAILSVWFVLLPLLIKGYNPLWVSVVISTLILGMTIFITHGRTIVSWASFGGSILAILCTTLFAIIASSWTNISGLVGDHNTTIAGLYGPIINLQQLTTAAMIIGIVGVLDDVAVMQAAMVREFMRNASLSTKEIFKKSMTIGQEHAAALVNTLVLAYTAVALPLFIVILSPANANVGQAIPWRMQLSNELFITEFVRSIVGCFGLVLTIPLVTALAIVLYQKYPPRPDDNSGHSHCHHHH